MNGFGLSDWLSLLSALGVIVALVSNLRSIRDKNEHKAEELTEMRSDIKHIRGQVDKSDVLMADIRVQLGDVKDRVTRLEESVKNAHHRLNALEGTE
ncbi:MAG: hypothetical protein IIW40_00705 [Clostridia bacterium]|nr:hypothetical protein [Clostridia bacterium]